MIFLEPDVKVEVYDNFLSKSEMEAVKERMLSPFFPWYLNEVLHKEDGYLQVEDEDNIQFCHTFYKNYSPNTQDMNLVMPLIDKIDPMAILRIKANLMGRTKNIVEHGYHTDYPQDTRCLTSVFYVNTNNGYTKFETGEVIESVENRLVVFDSRLAHTGTTCTDEKIRCVINVNFVPWR